MKPFTIAPECAELATVIEQLHAQAFGPGRFARAAFRLREQGGHDVALSHVALDAMDTLAGSVRLTWIRTAAQDDAGLLLGPLAVRPDRKNTGIGRALVAKSVETARAAGAAYVLLVGDAPYYGPLGFEAVPAGQILLPGPVDPSRLLMCPIAEGALEATAGMVFHANRFRLAPFAPPHR